jgi:hypothetical protein
MEGEESNMNDRIIQHLWKLRTEESDGSKDMAHLEGEQGLYWHLWSLQEKISSATTSLHATVLPYKKMYFIRVKKLYEKM